MCCKNLTETLYVSVVFLYFLIGNLNQNVCNCKFSNVNNEFNVTNVRNEKFPKIFHIN